jgi:predicted Zn-dependent peptidase
MAVLSYPIATHTLANGLRVVVSTDHNVPAVAVQVRYDVGSRDEQPGRTGFAHLFEHLMFQGSAHVRSGEHFGALQAEGAVLNGTTSFDRTNYYETLPSGGLDLALWLEADRMATLLDAVNQTNLDTQRDVVKEEKRQSYDNQPYGTWLERCFALLFPPGHPYAHLPIGSMADLDAATLDDVHAFFHRYYGPNNAALAIVGDIEADDAFERAERYFGPIARIPEPPEPPDGTIGPLAGPAIEEVVEDVPAAAAYRVMRLPPDPSPGLNAAHVALELLGGGSSSRLHRRLLRHDQLATAVYAGVIGMRGGVSVGQVVLQAHEGAPLEPLEDAADAEIARLLDEGPTADEVATAKAQLEHGYLRRLGTYAGRADELAKLVLGTGEPQRVNSWLQELDAVGLDDVNALIRQYLDPRHCAVVRFRPTAAAAEGQETA